MGSILALVVGLFATAVAPAQTALLASAHTVVAAGQPPAVEHEFTVKNAGTYTVTLTDLGSKLNPAAPLAEVAMAVTQGSALVGKPTSVTAAGTPITLTAAANTTYTIHVAGIPGTQLGSGPIEEDVTDSGGNKVFSSVDTLASPNQQPSGVGILSDTFTVSSAGTYTVALHDSAFPVALQSAGLVIVDQTSGSAVTTLSGFGSVQASLAAGTVYQIIAYAQESSSAPAGLFSVSVGTGTAMVYGPKLVTVGAMAVEQTTAAGKPTDTFQLGSTSATLALTNLAFPSVPLSSVGAAVVDAGTGLVAATVSGTAQQSFTPPSASDTYQVFAYAVPDTTAGAGAYAVSVQQGTAFPFSAAGAVTASSAQNVFNFDVDVPSSGAYALTLTDFKFPVALSGAALAVVQNGQLLGAVSAAGNFTASLSQGPATVLAFGDAGGSAGVMGLTLAPSGGGGALLDRTEGIGTGFSSSTFTASGAQAVQANVADLQFPAALQNLDLAVTSGTKLVGTIASAGSSGSFPFQTSANTTYTVTVLAQPATGSSGGSQQLEAGTYAVSVDPSPTVTLTAASTSVTSGSSVKLTWTVQNATSCTASGGAGWSGSESANGGSFTTSALTADTTFSLSCTGAGGTASASAKVTVTAASASGSGGGGALSPGVLLALALLVAFRAVMERRRL